MADSSHHHNHHHGGNAVIAPDVAPATLGTSNANHSNTNVSEKHDPVHGVARAQTQTPPEYQPENEKAGVNMNTGNTAANVDGESHQQGDDVRPAYSSLHLLAHLAAILLFLTWWVPALILRPENKVWIGVFILWVGLIVRTITRYVPNYRRPLIHAFILSLFTGWWVTTIALHRNDKNWVVPFLLWLAIAIRIITFYVPSRYVSQAMRWVWDRSVVKIVQAIPARFRTLAGAAGAIAVILVGSFVSEESADNTRANRAVSLVGMALILFGFWATSANRKRINWHTVIVGMLSQYIIGLFVLRTQVGLDIFRWIADRAGDFLGFAKDGVSFLTTPDTANLPWFFFGVIPAIIFFISVVQVLYYIGFLQWFVRKVATFVFWGLGVSGAEAVVAAATPFIGQGESAMLVRPFVPHMTKAELHQIMTCGFATISGSVLAGYIALGLNAEVLVSSCIMSIPASLAISKLRYPEVEETLTAGRVVIPEDTEDKAENALHAFANGALLGIKIAGSIVTSILCILAVVGLVNGLLGWWGSYLNIQEPKLTLQYIVSYIFYPVAFMLGVPLKDKSELGPGEDRDVDVVRVARLIAEKVVTNEYNAFAALAKGEDYENMADRSILIATYAVCGFGNIGSLGIQIGILSQLAPSRGGDVAKLAVSALITGVFATLTSAAVAGLVVTTQASRIIADSQH